MLCQTNCNYRRTKNKTSNFKPPERVSLGLRIIFALAPTGLLPKGEQNWRDLSNGKEGRKVSIWDLAFWNGRKSSWPQRLLSLSVKFLQEQLVRLGLYHTWIKTSGLQSTPQVTLSEIEVYNPLGFAFCWAFPPFCIPLQCQSRYASLFVLQRKSQLGPNFNDFKWCAL